MSVIHEALKKAGQPITAPTKKEAFRPELLKKRGRINWGPLFVVGILVLVTAPILAPVFHRESPNVATPEVRVDPSNRKAQFAVEEIPVTPVLRPMLPRAAASTPKFSLTGLIYSAGGSYCLINGHVIKIGDSVGGATLVDVTPNTAVLEYQGGKIVLTSDT